MASSPVPALEARIAELERQLSDLRRRVVALERLVGSAGEHPTDRSVTQGKVTYDWQS
ncbi:MAG TPA: hypothetical protein VMG36_05310 [Thermoplasmata archaeon]|nr:hypothetical protein [Thermoplasmata archaeon]